MDPFDLFDRWFVAAHESEANDPEAMALATATRDGRPSVRMVLLKGHGPHGFTFYTNSLSRKGNELADNGNAALLFHWKSIRKQVRIEGPVEEVPEAEADDYFASRSRDSQVGAHASLQSQHLEHRDHFLARVRAAHAQFEGKPVPRPHHWRGYRVVPTHMEFWEDRDARLHHRRVFVRDADGNWQDGLLYP
ncbi:pyridoxamine 5'-phosphate oxidase [Sphingomicrobium nitratireducens]|uniref:pyridoxamine 5'-phosphate oxidase n=1 Tax=Sphingomicrobium nitratireducens TaxID=2964666 RepID=UPI00223FCF64|nr:pyridoxamine 5'-phosphate oxidase [Sphingomicrobium nitratireducens]